MIRNMTIIPVSDTALWNPAVKAKIIAIAMYVLQGLRVPPVHRVRLGQEAPLVRKAFPESGAQLGHKGLKVSPVLLARKVLLVKPVRLVLRDPPV